ncbi:MAG: hypothetical protein IPG58_10005 [Acidobacteria bacterium]|nr:hypothetical protein [Acidobacteriota bacterium]
MNNADWETVKEVFGLVIDEPVETRDKLLRQRCGDDEALYAEVHSLIVASTESDNIIESNAIDLAAKIDLPKVDYADRHLGITELSAR